MLILVKGQMTLVVAGTGGSLYEKKNAVYYFQMSLFVPDIFKILKYA